MELEELKLSLKKMIVTECDKSVDPMSIQDDEQLIGGPLQLDSLDALQISLAVKDRYDVRIENGPEARRTLASVAALAKAIMAARAA